MVVLAALEGNLTANLHDVKAQLSAVNPIASYDLPHSTAWGKSHLISKNLIVKIKKLLLTGANSLN